MARPRFQFRLSTIFVATAAAGMAALIGAAIIEWFSSGPGERTASAIVGGLAFIAISMCIAAFLPAD